jgi:tRNA-(ms[2]io[6]A)-hydroxylase
MLGAVSAHTPATPARPASPAPTAIVASVPPAPAAIVAPVAPAPTAIVASVPPTAEAASPPPTTPTTAAVVISLEVARASVPLRSGTSDRWCAVALLDLQTLLDDHAQCELKAASSALSLIARNPEREELVHRMMALAREELLHYRQVRDVMRRRGLQARRPQRSPYLAGLTASTGGGEPLLAALVTCAVIEARSCERFVALGAALATSAVPGGLELSSLYAGLARSESGHAHVFVELAELYFSREAVARELERRVESEAQVLTAIPVSARMHGGNGP